MPFEIEMLAVGVADSMILRYVDPSDREFVILIDAGNKKEGTNVVDNIKKWTRNQYIDLAISTHPDGDHIGGFFMLSIILLSRNSGYMIHPITDKKAIKQPQIRMGPRRGYSDATSL